MELVTPEHHKGATVFRSHRTGHRWRQPHTLSPAPLASRLRSPSTLGASLASGPSFTGGSGPDPPPAGPGSTSAGTQTGGLRPPGSPRGRHAPSPRAARAARPLGREVASPHAGRSGEGARVSARRPGSRPLCCGSAPTAGGGALLGADSSRPGFPRGPGRGSRGDWGGGGERGLGRRGERGRKGGNQTRNGRKGGRGKIRRGRKAQSPPPAAACALRHHVRRNRHRVLRPERPCFLCACLHAYRRPLPTHPPPQPARTRCAVRHTRSLCRLRVTCVFSRPCRSTATLSSPEAHQVCQIHL